MNVKEFFQKTWITIKHFWYIPVLVVLAGLTFLLAKGSGKNVWLDLIKGASSQYKDDMEKVNEIHRKELEARDKAQRDAETRRQQIETAFQEQNRALTEERKKEIEKIIKDTKNDPTEIAKKLSEQYGFEVVLPPTTIPLE